VRFPLLRKRMVKRVPRLRRRHRLPGHRIAGRIAPPPSAARCQALRDHDHRAQTSLDTFLLNRSFVIMGAIVGYAGGLLAFMRRCLRRDLSFWQHAGDALLMAVLGVCTTSSAALWAHRLHPLEDRLSAINRKLWLLFAPMYPVRPRLARGHAGLVFRLMLAAIGR